MKISEPMLGYYDIDGKLHEVKKLSEIESRTVFTDEVHGSFPPELHDPGEFLMKVEVSPEFAAELKAVERKVDEAILDGYDAVYDAVERCLNSGACAGCAFEGEAFCKMKLAKSVMTIIKNQRDLVAKAIEEKWKDDAETGL